MDEKMFDHTDAEGDRLFFNTVSRTSSNPAYLVFGAEADRESQAVAVRLDGHVVRDLHAALGKWLNVKDSTEAPVAPDSLIDQLVKRSVAEEVARVLPLHLAPFAIVNDGRCEEHCQVLHDQAGAEIIHDAADPEPHDVGIVDEPPARTHPVDWSDAIFGKPEYHCPRCKHLWVDHGKFGIRGCTVLPCECTRARQASAQPEFCTCPVGPRIRSYPHSHIAGCPRSSSSAQ